MLPVSVTVSQDKVSVRISIGDSHLDLRVAEADALMHRLIEARPYMLPPVQAEPSPPPTPRAIEPREVHINPSYQMPRGGVTIHTVHPSLGWITWFASCKQARTMAGHLAEWTVPADPFHRE